MPDEVDELILKMQHLEAQARAQREAQALEGRGKSVKARAKLNFALDQMDQAERREYEALRADARAEAHRQMADDPLFKGTTPAPTAAATSNPTPNPTSTPTPTPTATPNPTSSSTPKPTSSSTPAAPRKTLGRRRPKGT